ncbi:MAG: DUF2845 domain-containing protein [Syntrophotaleaceae bacterium]
MLLLWPALAGAICEPDEGMTKDEVFTQCGPPDYAEVIRSDESDTALPLNDEDAELLQEEHPLVLWHYNAFEGEASRIILFREGRVVRCCLPDMD